jgi:hypothetical protein
MGARVNLHIEELVLNGFSPGDRHRIGQAVEFELARLITEQGIPSSLSREGGVARMDGGRFNMWPNSGAEVIGGQVARSVYEGFGK